MEVYNQNRGNKCFLMTDKYATKGGMVMHSSSYCKDHDCPWLDRDRDICKSPNDPHGGECDLNWAESCPECHKLIAVGQDDNGECPYCGAMLPTEEKHPEELDFIPTRETMSAKLIVTSDSDHADSVTEMYPEKKTESITHGRIKTEPKANEFVHRLGENDAEYIRVLEKTLARQQQITSKAIQKVKMLQKQLDAAVAGDTLLEKREWISGYENRWYRKKYCCPQCGINIRTESWNEKRCFGAGTILRDNSIPRFCPECGLKILENNYD